MRKELRKWRREGGNGRKYKELKREYGRLCEEKRSKEVERWMKEVEGVRTEGEVWKVVNRGRKRKGRVNEGIAMGDWDEYFRGLLGGVEWRVRRGGETRRWDDGEAEIGRE